MVVSLQLKMNSILLSHIIYSILNTHKTQQNIFHSQYSLNTLHENFEIPTLNQAYSITSAHSSQDTEIPNHTPCKINSPSLKFPKSKHYRKRTTLTKHITSSKLRNKLQTSSIKTLTPVYPKHSVTNSKKSSTEISMDTKLNCCHCDDPNLQLF